MNEQIPAQLLDVLAAQRNNALNNAARFEASYMVATAELERIGKELAEANAKIAELTKPAETKD